MLVAATFGVLLQLVLQANAEYIKLVDNFIPVPGGSNNHNYANVDLILDIAKRIPVQVKNSHMHMHMHRIMLKFTPVMYTLTP